MSLPLYLRDCSKGLDASHAVLETLLMYWDGSRAGQSVSSATSSEVHSLLGVSARAINGIATHIAAIDTGLERAHPLGPQALVQLGSTQKYLWGLAPGVDDPWAHDGGAPFVHGLVRAALSIADSDGGFVGGLTGPAIDGYVAEILAAETAQQGQLDSALTLALNAEIARMRGSLDALETADLANVTSTHVRSLINALRLTVGATRLDAQREDVVASLNVVGDDAEGDDAEGDEAEADEAEVLASGLISVITDSVAILADQVRGIRVQVRGTLAVRDAAAASAGDTLSVVLVAVLKALKTLHKQTMGMSEELMRSLLKLDSITGLGKAPNARAARKVAVGSIQTILDEADQAKANVGARIKEVEAAIANLPSPALPSSSSPAPAPAAPAPAAPAPAAPAPASTLASSRWRLLSLTPHFEISRAADGSTIITSLIPGMKAEDVSVGLATDDYGLQMVVVQGAVLPTDNEQKQLSGAADHQLATTYPAMTSGGSDMSELRETLMLRLGTGRFGSFRREFPVATLTGAVQPLVSSAIAASYEDAVLRVTIKPPHRPHGHSYPATRPPSSVYPPFSSSSSSSSPSASYPFPSRSHRRRR